MGRNKLEEGQGMDVTLSFRIDKHTQDRIIAAIDDTGVNKSEVYRRMLSETSDKQLERIVKTLIKEKFEEMETLSLMQLKQKRRAAERDIAWIDAKLAKMNPSRRGR